MGFTLTCRHRTTELAAPVLRDALAGYSDEPHGASPRISRPAISESPHNRLRTPSFHHSLASPRPTLSHPHSSTRYPLLAILKRLSPISKPKDSQLAEASEKYETLCARRSWEVMFFAMASCPFEDLGIDLLAPFLYPADDELQNDLDPQVIFF